MFGFQTFNAFRFFRKHEVHHKAVNMMRNLLTSHDFDSRFNETSLRCRVANLYLPLIAIIIDNLPKLFAWTAEGEVRIVGNANQNEQHLNLILNVISDNLPNVSLKCVELTSINCCGHFGLTVAYMYRECLKNRTQFWLEDARQNIQNPNFKGCVAQPSRLD